MNNIGLVNIKNSNLDNFTSNSGLKLRRMINPILKKILKMATKRNIIMESYPELKKNIPYIFASTHSFDEDVIANLANIDRNVYVLVGTTDQIDHNPKMYMAWVNGIIYVNRLNPQSRKDSLDKMEKVLNNGTSILIFPEGGWNNTENLLCQPLFASPYILAQRTGFQVVPIASFNEHDSNDIHIKVGNAIDLSEKTKKEALSELRDALSTMMYELIEKYSTPLIRTTLSADCRMQFLEQRKKEYLRVKWSRDVWDEELAFYRDKEYTTPEEALEFLGAVEINEKNAHILRPFIRRRFEYKKYNFKNYMK